jgi:hypothetical protein
LGALVALQWDPVVALLLQNNRIALQGVSNTAAFATTLVPAAAAVVVPIATLMVAPH